MYVNRTDFPEVADPKRRNWLHIFRFYLRNKCFSLFSMIFSNCLPTLCERIMKFERIWMKLMHVCWEVKDLWAGLEYTHGIDETADLQRNRPTPRLSGFNEKKKKKSMWGFLTPPRPLLLLVSSSSSSSALRSSFLVLFFVSSPLPFARLFVCNVNFSPAICARESVNYERRSRSKNKNLDILFAR